MFPRAIGRDPGAMVQGLVIILSLIQTRATDASVGTFSGRTKYFFQIVLTEWNAGISFYQFMGVSWWSHF